ncbi:hypothetical protein Tco_1214297, partial [Tanacetum coccineum]
YKTTITTTASSFEAEQDSGGDTPGSDEGSKKLNELTELCSKLFDRVTSLEKDLKQTKKVHAKALTKLVKKVKHLADRLKSTTTKRKEKMVISDEEEDLDSEDPSKQGRMLEIERRSLFSTVEDIQNIDEVFQRAQWARDLGSTRCNWCRIHEEKKIMVQRIKNEAKTVKRIENEAKTVAGTRYCSVSTRYCSSTRWQTRQYERQACAIMRRLVECKMTKLPLDPAISLVGYLK